MAFFLHDNINKANDICCIHLSIMIQITFQWCFVQVDNLYLFNNMLARQFTALVEDLSINTTNRIIKEKGCVFLDAFRDINGCSL